MPSGGAAAYRRGAWEAAGGFDEALFAYGEDVDLGLRLRSLGWEAAEAPAARAVHLGGATPGWIPRSNASSPASRADSFCAATASCASRAAPRALAIEALVVGWGLIRHRTLVPLRRARSGWRAAGRGGRHRLAAGDRRSGHRGGRVVRRLRTAR